MDFSVIRRQRPANKAEPPPAPPPPPTEGPPPGGAPSHPMRSYMEEMDRGLRSIEYTNTHSWRANFGDDYYCYDGYRQMPMGPPLPPSPQRMRPPPPDHYRGMPHQLALPPPDYHRPHRMDYDYGPPRRDPYQMDYHYGPQRRDPYQMDYQYGPPRRDPYSMDYHYGPSRRDPYYGGRGGGYWACEH